MENKVPIIEKIILKAYFFYGFIHAFFGLKVNASIARKGQKYWNEFMKGFLSE